VETEGVGNKDKNHRRLNIVEMEKKKRKPNLAASIILGQ